MSRHHRETFFFLPSLPLRSSHIHPSRLTACLDPPPLPPRSTLPPRPINSPADPAPNPVTALARDRIDFPSAIPKRVLEPINSAKMWAGGKKGQENSIGTRSESGCDNFDNFKERILILIRRDSLARNLGRIITLISWSWICSLNCWKKLRANFRF